MSERSHNVDPLLPSHPELDSFSGIMPVSQHTLHDLRDLIEEKTEHERYVQGMRGTGLDSLRDEILTVWHREEGLYCEPSQKIAAVYSRERVGEYGGKLVTAYSLMTTGDGLTLDKEVKMNVPRAWEWKLASTSFRLTGDHAWEQRIRRAADFEKTVGLQTPSEEETRNLIRFIALLEPCGLPV